MGSSPAKRAIQADSGIGLERPDSIGKVVGSSPAKRATLGG
ncbi:MAG: hypothetical protein ABR886_02570 [Dehalococcoidales bacterium]